MMSRVHSVSARGGYTWQEEVSAFTLCISRYRFSFAPAKTPIIHYKAIELNFNQSVCRSINFFAICLLQTDLQNVPFVAFF